MFCDPEYGLYWWMSHVTLRKMCVLLLLDEVVYRYSLQPLLFSSTMFLLSFCLQDLSINWKKNTEVSNYNSELIYVSCSSTSFYFMQSDALLLGVYTLRINVSLEKQLLYHYVMSLFTPDNFSSEEEKSFLLLCINLT